MRLLRVLTRMNSLQIEAILGGDEHAKGLLRGVFARDELLNLAHI